MEEYFMMCCLKKTAKHHVLLQTALSAPPLSLRPSVLKAFFSGLYPFFYSSMWTKQNLCMVVGMSSTITKPYLVNSMGLICLFFKYVVTLMCCHKIRWTSWRTVGIKNTHQRFCLKLFHCVFLMKSSKYWFFFSSSNSSHFIQSSPVLAHT